MPKLEDVDATRKPTVRIDPRELRRLVVSLVVTVDEDDQVTPFEGVPAVREVRPERRDADDDPARGL